MNRWLLNTIGVAILAALGLAAWGCFALNRSALVLIQDSDTAIRAQSQTSANLQSITASSAAFAADAADEMHQIAHPTKGQQALKVVHALIPGIF